MYAIGMGFLIVLDWVSCTFLRPFIPCSVYQLFYACKVLQFQMVFCCFNSDCMDNVDDEYLTKDKIKVTRWRVNNTSINLLRYVILLFHIASIQFSHWFFIVIFPLWRVSKIEIWKCSIAQYRFCYVAGNIRQIDNKLAVKKNIQVR